MTEPRSAKTLAESAAWPAPRAVVGNQEREGNLHPPACSRTSLALIASLRGFADQSDVSCDLLRMVAVTPVA
jgi:hypothetical protein